MIMAIRRIAVEEAFVTPEIMTQWHVVLAGRAVEPGFAKMGESILAQTPANKPLDDRLLDIGAGRIDHKTPLRRPLPSPDRPQYGRSA
jgi:5-carboxyvanillate decarboxylase